MLTKQAEGFAEIVKSAGGDADSAVKLMIADKLEEMINILRTLGCEVPSPNITLSFITLIFIPCFGITDQGLFDVREFKIIDPIISLN